MTNILNRGPRLNNFPQCGVVVEGKETFCALVPVHIARSTVRRYMVSCGKHLGAKERSRMADECLGRWLQVEVTVPGSDTEGEKKTRWTKSPKTSSFESTYLIKTPMI